MTASLGLAEVFESVIVASSFSRLLRRFCQPTFVVTAAITGAVIGSWCLHGALWVTPFDRIYPGVFLLLYLRLCTIVDSSLLFVNRPWSRHLLSVSLTTCFLILTAAGIVFVTVDYLSFDESVFFVVVTVSTVGYGNTVPDTVESRCAVIFLILAAIIVLPLKIGALVNLYGLGPCRINDMLAGTPQVLVCGDLSAAIITQFVAEFFHPDHDIAYTDLQLCVLSRDPPSDDVRALLRDPFYLRRVSYVQAAHLRDALRLGLVQRDTNVRSCFILSSRGGAEGGGAMMLPERWRRMQAGRSLLLAAATSFVDPGIRVILEVNSDLNERYARLAGAHLVIPKDRMEGMLLALSCVCPGLSTLICNLTFSYRGKDASARTCPRGWTCCLFPWRACGLCRPSSGGGGGGGHGGREPSSPSAATRKLDTIDVWEDEYCSGMAHELYEVPFGAHLAGRTFAEVATLMYAATGACLIAVFVPKGGASSHAGGGGDAAGARGHRREGSDRYPWMRPGASHAHDDGRILVNPGTSYTIGGDELGFVIAGNRESATWLSGHERLRGGKSAGRPGPRSLLDEDSPGGGYGAQQGDKSGSSSTNSSRHADASRAGCSPLSFGALLQEGSLVVERATSFEGSGHFLVCGAGEVSSASTLLAAYASTLKGATLVVLGDSCTMDEGEGASTTANAKAATPTLRGGIPPHHPVTPHRPDGGSTMGAGGHVTPPQGSLLVPSSPHAHTPHHLHAPHAGSSLGGAETDGHGHPRRTDAAGRQGAPGGGGGGPTRLIFIAGSALQPEALVRAGVTRARAVVVLAGAGAPGGGSSLDAFPVLGTMIVEDLVARAVARASDIDGGPHPPVVITQVSDLENGWLIRDQPALQGGFPPAPPALERSASQAPSHGSHAPGAGGGHGAAHPRRGGWVGPVDASLSRHPAQVLPRFCSGHLFSRSQLDALAVCAYHNPHVVRLVLELSAMRAMVPEEAHLPAASGLSESRFILLPVTTLFPDSAPWGRAYGHVHKLLTSVHHLVPVGVYRNGSRQGAPRPYVVTNPAPGFLLYDDDSVYVIV
eukprot:jgi/Mesvir1/8997/Mv21290-RA.1